jgi:hypothetical protein
MTTCELLEVCSLDIFWFLVPEDVKHPLTSSQKMCTKSLDSIGGFDCFELIFLLYNVVVQSWILYCCLVCLHGVLLWYRRTCKINIKTEMFCKTYRSNKIVHFGFPQNHARCKKTSNKMYWTELVRRYLMSHLDTWCLMVYTNNFCQHAFTGWYIYLKSHLQCARKVGVKFKYSFCRLPMHVNARDFWLPPASLLWFVYLTLKWGAGKTLMGI